MTINLPESDYPLLLRTDFSNDLNWNKILEKIKSPQNEYEAVINFVSDKKFEALPLDHLPHFEIDQDEHDFIFLADEVSMNHIDQPILCIDLADEFGKNFRILPSILWAAANNLFISNMEFNDFADTVDEEGIYRR